MSRKKIFNPLEAKKRFNIQRWILLSIVLGMSAGIYFYWQGFPYNSDTSDFLWRLKRSFELSKEGTPYSQFGIESGWELTWANIKELGYQWDVWMLAFLLVALPVSIHFYRNRVKRFVFLCPKCRKAIWIRDPWECESCGEVNVQTKKYNIFTKCAACKHKQDAYQCPNLKSDGSECNEILPIIEGADLRTFAKKHRGSGSSSGQTYLSGGGQAMQVVPPSRTEVLPRDRSFF
jgi:hypothetical protein